MRPIRVLASIAAAVAISAPLAAQLPTDGLVWSLYGLRAGSCVHFLAPLKMIEDVAPSGFVPTSASTTPGIHPALAREIASETQYADWVPSRFCWFAFDSAMTGGRTVRARNDTRRAQIRPVAVGYWAAAIHRKGSVDGASEWAALAIFSNDGTLAQSLVPARYDVSSADFDISPIDGSTDTRYQVQFDKNIIGWDGHLGDPMAPERQVDTLSVGQTYVRLLLTAGIGDSAYYAAGNLRLTGKGKLVAAMAASPIRMLGPITRSEAPLTWWFRK
ncbi:MAG: hypothetical protein WBC97_03645 [Gemmatimonadales bacterium]